MLSAAPPPFPSSKTNSSLLRDVRVLYRRVCVLRVSGKVDEADELLSGKLAEVLTRARESREISETELDAVFASEEDRVDTAQTLAEILLPLLTTANEAAFSAFSAAARVSAPVSRFAPDNRLNGASTSPEPIGSSDGPSPAANHGSGPMLPGIADFIDEMLTQDRAPLAAQNHRRHA